MLTIGDKMPMFTVADQNGNIITQEQLIGKKTVLYFYPKDSTPGCTAEACNIRDNYERFLAQGYQVFGVSKDSQKSHQNFIAKNNHPFHYYLTQVPRCCNLSEHGAKRKCVVRHASEHYAKPLSLMNKVSWFRS